jgi:hypothetical protein
MMKKFHKSFSAMVNCIYHAKMKILILVSLFALFALSALLASPAYASGSTEFEKTIQDKTQSASGGGIAEIFRDWRPLSILAIMTSVILVGIGYAVGIGLEMPDIKAWAGSELVQAFANVIIIITLMATVAVIDVIAQEMVQNSGITVVCSGGQSCLGNVSKVYLDSYIESAASEAEEVAKNSIESAGWANRRFGLYCTSILCLQLGASFTILGHYILEQDRYAIVFEYYSNIISSLEAQKFFVEHIAFNIGPLILAAGIVARSFFFTRKIGGLLIATAAGIMFFLPGMYVFDWLTLDTTLSGDKANKDFSASTCPTECAAKHPLAVIENGIEEGIKLGDIKEIYATFPNESAKVVALLEGTSNFEVPSEGSYSGMQVISCMVVSNDECPMACRDLPYPVSLAECMNTTGGNVQKNCAALPAKCWVKRIADADSADNTTLSMCPMECRVIPPLKNNCDSGSCLDSRADCRLYKKIDDTGVLATDFQWMPSPPADISGSQKTRCEQAQQCPKGYTANESCVYVMPETGLCGQLCAGCPEVCRITTSNESRLPDNCFNSETQPACDSCPVGCKVNATHIERVTSITGDMNCTGCYAERRIITYGETLPLDYITGACDIDTSCKVDYRAPIPRSSCEQCLYSDESQMYNPPIQPNCPELCRPSDELPTQSPAAYRGVGSEGLSGTSEIQNVSKLMLPAYILPMFNILATIVFIRGVSAILGGDIEIPGISKVF